MEIDHTLYPPDAESGLEIRYSIPNRCLHIYDLEGSESRVDVDDETMLRQAVEDFMKTGKDRILDFIAVPSGAEYSIRVSRIGDWLVSSSDTRLMSRTIQVALDRAAKAKTLFDNNE